MIWSEEAEKAIGKVPFFVRKRVRARVEEEAARRKAARVLIEHVDACQKCFLSGKESDLKGFEIETCFGPSGCENRTVESDRLLEELEKLLSARNFPKMLRERVGKDIKFHHGFRISISECPNACSRPQIVDIGIIGARRPEKSDEYCEGCEACLEACREDAVRLDSGDAGGPVLDTAKCVGCGKCIEACPSGALREAQRGYRVLIGGKLGRHPRLGKELEGLYSAEEVLGIVKAWLDFYFTHNRAGERLGAILERMPEI